MFIRLNKWPIILTYDPQLKFRAESDQPLSFLKGVFIMIWR